MPLIPLRPTDLEVVKIDGDVYRLRKYLSLADFALSSALIMQASVLAASAQVMKDPRYLSTVMDKVPEVAQSARQSIEQAAQVSCDLMALWLVSWSHDDELTPDNIERIPQAHVKAIQEAIAELHAANKGEDDDSDAGKSSPQLSEPISTEKQSA